MPEYLAPGVYVEEQDLGPVPIEGVSTSTAGFVGRTAQGQDSGSPVLVTSFAEFTRTFGGYLQPLSANDTTHYLPYAVQGFFENGGERVYIQRVISGTAAAATSNNVTGGLITRLAKNAKRTETTLNLNTLRGIDINTKLTLTQIVNGITTTEGPLGITAYDEGKKQVTVAPLGNDYDARYTVITTNLVDPNPANPLVITAKNKGDWANTASTSNHLIIQILVPPPVVRAQVVSLSATLDTVVLNSSANFYVGAIVEFNRGTTKVYGKVKSIAGKSIVLTTPFANATDLGPNTPAAPAPAGAVAQAIPPTIATTCEFGLSVFYNSVVHNYPTLTLDKNTPYYFDKLDNHRPARIRISGAYDAGS